MRGLLSYRFLRRFAGDLKNRRKQPIFDDQRLETDVDLVVGPDCSASEEDSENQVSNSADIQIKEEKNKHYENKI